MTETRSQGEYNLVILRHGESVWNKDNLFTGWRDVGLSQRGIVEAQAAAQLLRQDRFSFDVAFTSVLQRAIHTLWLVLEQMELLWIPVYKSWRLNERHYGSLQGKDKLEAVKRFGEAQVQQWRRGYDVRPPLAEFDSPQSPKFDPRYKGLSEDEIPRGESLKDVMCRVLPYWESKIAPELQAGKKVLIVAHGNSLRALVKHIEQLTDEQVIDLNLATGVPVAYELDKDLKVVRGRVLGEPDEIAEKIKRVVEQTQREAT